MTSSKKIIVIIPDLHHCKTFQVNPESLAKAGQQWAETSFPLDQLSAHLHPSAHADVRPSLTFQFTEGGFHLSRIISGVTFCQLCIWKCLSEASGSVPGQSKEKSRSLNKLTWNKIYSSSFNEYQNILPVRERNHFYLLWSLSFSFNALSNVLSKLRTWIHNSCMSGHLWTWRFSSSLPLSGSFSLIHSLCLNYSFLFTHSAEKWNLLKSGSQNRWESSID